MDLKDWVESVKTQPPDKVGGMQQWVVFLLAIFLIGLVIRIIIFSCLGAISEKIVDLQQF